MMAVLIFEVYLKDTDIDHDRKIFLKMEVGEELPAIIKTENIPRLSGTIRTQKQTNLLVSDSHNQFFNEDC